MLKKKKSEKPLNEEEEKKYYALKLEAQVTPKLRTVKYCPYCGSEIKVKARKLDNEGNIYVCTNCDGANANLDDESVSIFMVYVFGGAVFDRGVIIREVDGGK